MRLYVHYDQTDATIILTINDSATLSDLIQHFTKSYNEKYPQNKQLNADKLLVFGEDERKKELSWSVSKAFKDKGDVFVRDSESSATTPKEQPNSTPTKSTSPSLSPTFYPPRLKKKEEEINVYPFEEKQTNAPTGLKKGMNWGKCSNCETMVQYTPGSKRVKCNVCNIVNLPVTTATSQTECSRCGKMIYSVQGSPIIRCYDCGNQLLAITCTKCKIPFCYPRGIRVLPCPSNCGNVMEDNRQDLEEITSGLEQKLVSESINIVSPEVHSVRPINLIVQYYIDQSPVRQAEIDKALENNIENEYITQIHLMLENVEDEKRILEKFKKEKLIIVKMGKRLRYKDAFEYASQHLKGQICILCNSDIFFDHTLRHLFPVDMTSRLYALTRYDVRKDGTILFNEWIAKLCQDSWIFVSPVPVKDMQVDFCLGQPGCDNRVCWEFQAIGWRVLNSCRRLVSRHLHSSEKRNYSKEDTVQGKYSMAFPTDALSVVDIMHKE